MTEISESAFAGTPVSIMRERRASARRPLNATVEMIQPADGGGVAINASDGGMRVAMFCYLRPGDVCLVLIKEDGAPERLERVRVVWSREVLDGCIAGLQTLALH